MDREEAGAKVFGRSENPVRALWEEVDDLLVSFGLARDVKTIYVSYTTQDMHVVAAAHPGNGFLELALALPENFDHPDVVDAVHLKWRTLPIAIHLSPAEGLPEDLPDLVAQAIAMAPGIEPREIEAFMRHRRQQEDAEAARRDEHSP